ncbi:MAG: NUDIX hydrolase [Alphaproteobacteria bacterium]
MAKTRKHSYEPGLPERAAGTRAVRPRDAATLIIYRIKRGHVEVLMGERHRKHKFQPQRYVFPGGAVDRSDSRVRSGAPARSDLLAMLERSATPARARGLVAAAVRETFEEAGLVIGCPDPEPSRSSPKNWTEFFDTGMAPDFSNISYVARAVTPPIRPMRFNARFFMIDAKHTIGELAGDGELLNLTYIPLAETPALKLARITQIILGRVDELARKPPRADSRRKVPFFVHMNGAHHSFME